MVLGAGAIGEAGAIQATSAHSETSEQVANNLAILGSIAALCTANNIGVQVDADLGNSAIYGDGTNALVDQWATAAAAAGLPIVSIENVEEIGISQPATLFASYASIEVNASGGTFTVNDGTHSASFVLSGSYSSDHFILANDGQNGTAISYLT